MIGRRRGSMLAAAALAALGAAGPRAVPGPEGPGLQTATELSLAASVVRADGTPVDGLRAADFDLRVDGQPATITAVTTDPRPLRVVLLLDVSASLRMGDLASGIVIQRAVDQWFPYGLAAGDTARIGTIGRRLFLSNRFTADHAELLQAGLTARSATALERQGPSPIWDAVDAAVTALVAEDARRAVVMMTDGRATGNRVGLRDVTAHALAADVSVHVVAERDTPAMLPQLDGSQVSITPGVGLRAIADNTGGTYVADRPFPWSDPGPLFARALTVLHHGYRVSFRPDLPDGRSHTVELRANPAELTVHARRSVVFPTRSHFPPVAGGRSGR